MQKHTIAMRILTRGIVANDEDEYLRIDETSTRKTLKKFVKSVTFCFAVEYLRNSTEQYLARLLCVREQGRFSNMIGSIDCMN